jgi:uncharacterized RDD family membrane protein YckC
VGEGGVEPPHPFGYRNLNPARLPIPPLARGDRNGSSGDLRTLGSARESAPTSPAPELVPAHAELGAPPAFTAPPAYAGFWIRVLGSIIDGLVLTPLYIPLAIRMVDRMDITSSTSFSSIDFAQLSGEVVGWALALQFVRYLYEFVMIGQWNATVGKFAVGIRVRRTDGSPATWREAALRPLLELVIGVLRIGLATLVDDLWMLWDKRKQTLHDKVAGTIVVKK